MAAPSSFEDARPPEILVFHVLNPILRRLLRSRWGRFVQPFALLEFDGRVTGRRFEVPVGWHPFNGNYLVVTPAQWRRNFAGGHPTIVHHGGRSSRQIGTLVEEPDEVAAILRSMTEAGFSLRRVGIRAPSVRPIGGADVSLLGRAIVRFGAPPS